MSKKKPSKIAALDIRLTLDGPARRALDTASAYMDMLIAQTLTAEGDDFLQLQKEIDLALYRVSIARDVWIKEVESAMQAGFATMDGGEK